MKKYNQYIYIRCCSQSHQQVKHRKLKHFGIDKSPSSEFESGLFFARHPLYPPCLTSVSLLSLLPIKRKRQQQSGRDLKCVVPVIVKLKTLHINVSKKKKTQQKKQRVKNKTKFNPLDQRPYVPYLVETNILLTKNHAGKNIHTLHRQHSNFSEKKPGINMRLG